MQTPKRRMGGAKPPLKNNVASLTLPDIALIKTLYGLGYTLETIGQMMGYTKETVRAVFRRVRWETIPALELWTRDVSGGLGVRVDKAILHNGFPIDPYCPYRAYAELDSPTTLKPSDAKCTGKAADIKLQ